MSRCLLVIDVQWGMFEGSKIPKVSNDEALLDKIHRLIERAHNAAAPLIFIQHSGEPDELLLAGTPAFALHPSIEPKADEPVIVKERPNAFHETSLHETLQRRGISHVVVCGIQTDACVDSTCRAAKDLGYEVTLVSDAHGTWSNKVLSAQQIIAHHNLTLKDYGFVKLCTTDEVTF